ncbi:hypothetical protein D3C72_1720430 [compost metagenome]
MVPELAQQFAHQVQATGEAREPVEGDLALQVKIGDAQVLAALQQRLAQVAYFAPVRWFRREYRIAHLSFRLALRGAFQSEKLRVVLQIVAARSVG